ncbi:hypothetical protein [Aeromonas veronii]|uniref:hypothetical protein n=1 Tax=Aeromonas veronii TaxID=654 RepID=UPI003D1AC0FF
MNHKESRDETIEKYKYNPFLVFLVVFFCCIDLSAPLVIYGTQLIFICLIAIYLIVVKKTLHCNLVQVLFLISALFLSTAASYYQQTYLMHQELLIKQYSRVTLWIVYGWIAFLFLRTQSVASIAKALKWIVAIMSTSVIIQVFAYYFMGGIVVDYSLIIGGESSRILFDVFRPAGLTSEPAIYSAILIGLLSIYFILVRKINYVIFIGAGSVLLTQSIAGIIMTGLFFLTVILSRPTIMKFSFMLVVCMSLIIAVAPLLENRYERFMNGNDTSNNTKIETFENMLKTDALLYTGYGFVGKSKSAPAFYEGLYDVTLWGANIVTYGIPIGITLNLAMLIFIIRIPIDFTGKILIMISLLKITSPMFIFFNVFISLVFVINGYDRAKLKPVCTI